MNEQIRTSRDALFRYWMTSRPLRRVVSALVTLGAGALLSRCVVFGGYAPFGVAFLAALAGDRAVVLALLGTLGGYASLVGEGIGAKYMAECMLILVTSPFLKWFLPAGGKVYPCALAGVAAGAVGLVSVFEGQGNSVSWVLYVAEVLLATLGAYLFRITVSREEADFSEEARYILRALCLGSLCPMLIYGVSVGRSLCVLMILWQIWRKQTIRAGMAAGLMSGLACDMTFGFTPFFALTMSLSGVFGAVFSKFGKILTSLAFLAAGAAVTVWGRAAGGEQFSLASLYEYAAGTLLFLVLPGFLASAGERVGIGSGAVVRKTSRAEDGHTEYLRRRMYDRLYGAAEAYMMVAEQTVAMKRDFPEQLIIPAIREQTCTLCPRRSECAADGIAEREFVNVKRKLEREGNLLPEDLSEAFLAFCPGYEGFAAELSKIWYASRVQKSYNARVNEGMEILASQYNSICHLLGRTAQVLQEDCTFAYDLETEVEGLLAEYDIHARVLVARDVRGRLSMEIRTREEDLFEKMQEHLEGCLSDTVGRKLAAESIRREGEYGTILMREALQYNYILGTAARRKRGSSKNGDYGSWFQTEDRLYLLLSDGMGSGEEARRESVRFGGLVEKLIQGGIDPEEAIRTAVETRLIADGMVMATVDLLEVELYGGSAVFYKSGAAPSYILSRGKARRVGNGGLYGEKIKGHREILTEGDLVVMLTDGTGDGLEDGALLRELESFTGKDPQSLCEALMKSKRITDRGGDDRSAAAVCLTAR
ncbi:MAG: SpoIIE family protein phosphatase [Clostridia bacterium]|nr:SpoIIE family protein phosphatase [Clostridia bacterium]